MVLITGASGFVGQHVLKEILYSEGNRPVYALANKKPIDSADLSVRIITGGLQEIHLKHELLSDVDCIVHLAAKNTGSTREEFYEINVEGTNNIIRLARRINARIIYISSTGVYGHKSFMNAAESTPKCPDTDFSRSKYQAELALKESGLPVLILRHRFIIGQGDRFVIPAFIKAYQKLPFRINNGRNMLSFIDVGDLARIIAQFCLNGWNSDEMIEYHVTNGEKISLREVEKKISSVFNISGKKKVSVNYIVASLIIRIGSMLPAMTGQQKVASILNRLKFLIYHNHFSNEQLASVLNNFSFSSFEESLLKSKLYYSKYLASNYEQ
jgi:2-alkyl-3-oxoalkanoate reductase